jgi:hypothetical protein
LGFVNEFVKELVAFVKEFVAFVKEFVAFVKELVKELVAFENVFATLLYVFIAVFVNESVLGTSSFGISGIGTRISVKSDTML